jgi:hypothetical protein
MPTSKRRPWGARSLLAGAAIGAAAVLAGLAPPPLQASVATTAAAGRTQVRLYGTVSQAQYVDERDDRDRGEGNNPFGNYAGSSVPAPTDENPFGPLAGDEAAYALDLYSDARHTKSVGTAIYVCLYNFDKNGFCNAAFQLKSGTVVAKGALNFTSTRFSLVVVGGTYGYRSMVGAVSVTTLGSATQSQPVFRPVPLLQSEQIVLTLTPG